MPCVITGNPPPNDPHHLKSKGSFGDDVEWNLIPLKHELHRELHKAGMTKFADKYPEFKKWLLTNGWIFESDKWRRYEND